MFVTWPYNFNGIGNTEIFKHIPDRNQKGLLIVYRNAEDIFKRIDQLLIDLEDWNCISHFN